MGSTIQPMYGTIGVNDQLVPVFTGSGTMFVPPAVGPTMRGYGQRPPATIPLGVTGSGAAVAQGSAASAAPFDLKSSPVVWALAFVVGAVLWLRYVHWRR